MTAFRIYVLLGALAILVGSNWRSHHQGYDTGFAEGQTEGQKKADEADAKRVLAEAQTTAVTATLAETDKAAKAAEAEAKAYAAKAAQAAKDAAAIRKQGDRDAAAFAKALEAATRTPDCATLKEILCPAARDY